MINSFDQNTKVLGKWKIKSWEKRKGKINESRKEFLKEDLKER